MATNLPIDPDLLNRALAVGCEDTEKAAVTSALEEYIARREHGAIVDLFGALEADPSFDHRRHRSRSKTGTA